ncbi:SPOR domain-containing protein [Cryobacterium sp. CG_9.6]|uniref:SPOR domain-containing protein n=1 Tax=Cryobacterium sp. CG_9.6 TaxID=2760710 RepID=UPI0024760D5C|nr:SPOR domain-containing protein [Cryobacterium sp. CG_9.6]MDH6237057.1 hypothetical protein [Cryobacterium sp. CG_9.6]
MAEDTENQYWYNMRTGAVEKGFQSPSLDRVGPFPTHYEATHALEKLRANSAKWSEDDARDNR